MKTLRKNFIKRKPLRKASAKAQSAMEYLMTYGWAILIVAVVLGALYSLGVFNGAAFLGTSCIAASGFYCTNPTLSTGGVLTVTIGQATGTTFKNAYLYFVPSGTNFSASDPSTSIGTLNSGQQVTVSIPLGVGSPYPATYTLGMPLSGYLYLQFTDIYGTTEVNKIATVLTKVTASSSGATFSQPTSIPSGIVAYVPITLTNSQSSATPSPFQQMIQINEGNYANYIAYNGNIANFEFYTQSGSVLPAWIESNNSGTLTVWVKLPNGIPASSSLTIYLGFASKSTNLLSSSGTTGISEAPQLPCPNPANTIGCSTYAQYDDGASVFPIYYNFAGTTLDSRISTISGVTLTQNNGLSVAVTTADTTFYILTSSSATSPFVMEADETYYGVSTSTNSNEQWGFVIDSSTPTSQNTGGTPAGTNYMTRIVNKYADRPEIDEGSTVIGQGSLIYASQYTAIDSFIQSPSGLTATFDGTSASASTNALTSGYIGFYIYSAVANSNIATIQWLRTRAYPPNGVMPSVSFGGLSTT